MAAVAVGQVLAGLLFADNGKGAAKAHALNARQAAFQVRAAAKHAMPADGSVYAHECTTSGTDALVAVAYTDGTGHALLINGVPVVYAPDASKGARVAVGSDGKAHGFWVNSVSARYTCKADAVAAYQACRAVAYFAHNAQCTPAKAKAAIINQTARVGVTSAVIVATRSARTAAKAKRTK